MPRTTKTTAPKVVGNLALAEDMSKHVIDEATAEAVAMTVNVFEKVKRSTTSKAATKTAEAEKISKISKVPNNIDLDKNMEEDMSSHIVDEETAEVVAMTVNVFEKIQAVPIFKPIAETVIEAVNVTEAVAVVKEEQTPISTQLPEMQPQRTPPQNETITHIPLTDLHPPEFNPFVVQENDSLSRLTDSIKEYGVREPGLVRTRKDDKGNITHGYELLIGGRRKRACELAELPTMPVIIRELDDDSAVIAMVDSNLEMRDRLLPSEKAWAYRIKMEALNHKGVKGDKLSGEIIAEQSGDSRNQVFRFIRLTELTIALLDKVDASKLAFNPAVELSYLSHKEQALVASAMEFNSTKPSLSQAKRLKMLKQDGKLTEEVINSVLSETKPKTSHHDKISNRFRRYFPADYSVRQMNDVIAGLLKNWQGEQITETDTNADINDLTL